MIAISNLFIFKIICLGFFIIISLEMAIFFGNKALIFNFKYSIAIYVLNKVVPTNPGI